MQATLTPVAEAFHDVPAARALPCGVTAHLVDPSHLVPGPAWCVDRHDRLTGARHTGWYADAGQFETLTGFVYACDAESDEEDDDPALGYYAIVQSSDTDCHYLDPDVYDDPVEAAHAADRMAELVAELERDCDAVRCLAMRARGQLAEANRTRRDALGILRHLGGCPADGEALGPAFARLWRQADAQRHRAFALVDEHRPPRPTGPLQTAPTITRAECLSDAWRDGWACGADGATATPEILR